MIAPLDSPVGIAGPSFYLLPAAERDGFGGFSESAVAQRAAGFIPAVLP